jgi:hypothetical protein
LLRVIFANPLLLRVHLAISGKVCNCHTRRWGCYWHLWVEARVTASHPTIYRKGLATENDLALNVHSAEMKKAYFGQGLPVEFYLDHSLPVRTAVREQSRPWPPLCGWRCFIY